MLSDGTYQVPARWQAGLSNVSGIPRLGLYQGLTDVYRVPMLEKSSVSSSMVSSRKDLDTDTPS